MIDACVQDAVEVQDYGASDEDYSWTHAGYRDYLGVPLVEADG